MSEPTLVDDLDAEAAMVEKLPSQGLTVDSNVLARAGRLRAHATRLREALARVEASEDWYVALSTINGGASPPVTPGRPGGGNVEPWHDCHCGGDHTESVHGIYGAPASPPTTPTCANCNRAMQPPGKIQCCSSPLHPRTP